MASTILVSGKAVNGHCEDQVVRGFYCEHSLKLIMSRQLRLSLSLFAVFVVILIGLPLMNYYLPALANYRIWGFTVSWFLLGIVFYPLTWAVAYIYVKRSLKLENQIAKKFKSDRRRLEA